jgi:hypothetical protein
LSSTAPRYDANVVSEFCGQQSSTWRERLRQERAAYRCGAALLVYHAEEDHYGTGRIFWAARTRELELAAVRAELGDRRVRSRLGRGPRAGRRDCARIAPRRRSPGECVPCNEIATRSREALGRMEARRVSPLDDDAIAQARAVFLAALTCASATASRRPTPKGEPR